MVRRGATVRRVARAFVLLAAGSAGAATFVVDDTADLVDVTTSDGACLTSAGTCTLRAALIQANASAEPDMVELPAGTYRITIPGASDEFAFSGDLDVARDVTLVGAGSDVTIVDAGRMDRAFHVRAASHASLSGVTIRGGYTPPYGAGGAVLVDVGCSLDADDCAFVDNLSDGPGAAVFADASAALTLDGCRVDSNASTRGGMAVEGNPIAVSPATLVVRRSAFTDNSTGALRGRSPFVAGCAFTNNASKGAIEVDGGNLLVRQSQFDGNSSGDVGGSITIVHGGHAIVEDSTFDGGSARSGGAVGCVECSGSQLTLERVTISGCRASADGGAVYWMDFFTGAASAVRIVDSTLTGNSAADSGGALFVAGNDPGATFVVLSTTLSGNVARSGGGICAAATAGHAFVLGSTLLDEEADAGAAIEARDTVPRIGVARSVLAGARGGTLCSGAIISDGDNLFDERTPGAIVHPSDRLGMNPLLGPLEDNGGSTLTHAPLPGSPLIDAAATNCVDETGVPIATDQRGSPRVVDGDLDTVDACDIGAVELVPDCVVDGDGDTVGDSCDCAPADPSVTLVPGPIDLRVATDRATGDAIVSWPDARLLFGSATTCDVASDSIAALARPRGANAPCVARGIDGPWTDARAVTDVGWYYLVRSSNSCGPAAGTGWGTDSLGRERPACP